MSSQSFADLQLCEPILRALQQENYSHPTPIQAATIPHLLAGRDLLGCAQTGTGKTAAFALPILQKLELEPRAVVSKSPRVLVLSPTRELASQIADSFATYGRHIRFRQAVIFGGVGQSPQVRAMTRGVHSVIATPGRLLDLMQQGFVRLDRLEVFVLDEADRMLDMGFLPALQQIISQLPEKRQSLFFTATLPRNIAELAGSLLRKPERVEVTPPSTTVERIAQQVLFVDRNQKRIVLREVLRRPEVKRTLIFARTKRGANDLAQQLCETGIQSDAIHGNKSQSAREKALHGFRVGRVKVLVATDLAARGIDVDGITHVINFDLPDEPESYVHRIGRTARAGAEGVALSFCDDTERSTLRAIERLIQLNIPVDPEFPATGLTPMASSERPMRRGKRPGGKPFGARRPGGGGPRSSNGPRSNGPRPGSKGPRRRAAAT